MASQTRKTTLQNRYRSSGYRYEQSKIVPELRLSGLWLEEIGFTGGQQLNIAVSKGKPVITLSHG